jgi:hypothetical protein
MKLLKLIPLFFLLLTTSCGTMFWSSSNAFKIHQGMTQREVISAVGKPDMRRFRSNVEEWEYVTIVDDRTVIIDFVDGRVSSLDSYDKSADLLPLRGHPTMVNPGDVYFNELYNNVNNAIGSDERQKVLNSNLRDASISCNECAKLLKLFTFDDDKVKALKLLAPHLSNNNYDIIVDCFYFESGKQTSKDILHSLQSKRNS